jgi:hypothetical protein
LPAEGLVFEFLTTPARDEASHLLRSEMGWSMASPFDGQRWLPRAGGPVVDLLLGRVEGP